MANGGKYTLDEIQYKLAQLRNKTTFVIQDSWKEVDDLKQVNSDYDTKIQTLQKKIEALQSMQKSKSTIKFIDDSNIDEDDDDDDDGDENYDGFEENFNGSITDQTKILGNGKIEEPLITSSSLEKEKDPSKTSGKNSRASRNGSIFKIFKQDPDNKRSSHEKTAKSDGDKNATIPYADSTSSNQGGSVHDTLRHILFDLEVEIKDDETANTSAKFGRRKSTESIVLGASNELSVSQSMRRRSSRSYRRASLAFTPNLPPPKEEDDLDTQMESLSFSASLDQDDDMEEEMARLEQYSHIEGSQVGEKIVERLKARLQHKENALISVRKCVEEQSHEIKQLNDEIAGIHSNFSIAKQKLEDECQEIVTQITNNYDIDASLEHSCLELESELEQMRAHENSLMKELSEFNEKVNGAELQETMYVKSLQNKLQEVNEKRNLCEVEIENMNIASSTIFHQLQSSLHRILIRDRNCDEAQIKYRKKLIKTFIKSYLKVREKESVLAKQLSSRLQHRMETEESLEGIGHMKESLKEFLGLLKDVHLNVSESLSYFQRSSNNEVSFNDESTNDNCDNINRQVVPYSHNLKRLLSFQPRTTYHTLATATCLENTIDSLTAIISSLSSVEGELQHQLSILQSGQYPENNATSKEADTDSIDNTNVLRKAEEATQKAVLCIMNAEDTLSIQIKELTVKEAPGNSSASHAAPSDKEKSSQDDIIEELEAELDFENAKSVALKRSTHQDKQILKVLEQDFSEMQSYAEKEFKCHLQSLEDIQEKTNFIKSNMDKNSITIITLEEEYSLRKEEEKRLKQDLDEIKRKAKRRAPCVPVDLSHTVL